MEGTRTRAPIVGTCRVRVKDPVNRIRQGADGTERKCLTFRKLVSRVNKTGL